jgi:hypothetical protein
MISVAPSFRPIGFDTERLVHFRTRGLGDGRSFAAPKLTNHVMQPSPRVDLGQWLPFPSDRLITTDYEVRGLTSGDWPLF